MTYQPRRIDRASNLRLIISLIRLYGLAESVVEVLTKPQRAYNGQRVPDYKIGGTSVESKETINA
jgi:hypothetical protein